MKSSPRRFLLSAACRTLFFAALVPAAFGAEEKVEEPVAPASVEATLVSSPRIDSKLKERLGLTDAQWAQLEAILVAKETRYRAEMDRHMVALRVLSSQTDAKLAEVLSEEQLTAYFSSERKGSNERLSAIAAEIRKRRELRETGKEAPGKK